LLQAQINIQSCQYLPALLELFGAHTKLNTWQAVIVSKDVCIGPFLQVCLCLLVNCIFLAFEQYADHEFN